MQKFVTNLAIKFRTYFVMIFLLISCVSPQQLTNKTIQHYYNNTTFTPEHVTLTPISNIEVTITPVDAASLNGFTFESASLDGNYEIEFASSIKQETSYDYSLPRKEIIRRKGILNGIDAINDLEYNNLISKQLSFQLKQRLLHGDEYGKDGSEISSISGLDNFTDKFNPYKLIDKYLSVIKATFVNNGDKIERISLTDMQIISGEELLYPFDIKYFESYFMSNPEKLKNAYRMNMPDELIIPPSQKITKYIAVPAINPLNETLKFQIIKEEDVINFEFLLNNQTINKSHFLTYYEIFVSETFEMEHDIYFAIEYENGIGFPLQSKHIFVSDENKTIRASIVALSINTYDSKAKAIVESIRFSDQVGNKVNIVF